MYRTFFEDIPELAKGDAAVNKEGNENAPGIQALVNVLKSDEIKQYINDTYDGAVVPVF